MKLATFLIKTMSGNNQIEIEAFTPCQAITIWKHSKPTELFRACILIKSSAERDRFYELKSISNPSSYEINEMELVVDNFKKTDIFKQYKKYPSFKNQPSIGK